MVTLQVSKEVNMSEEQKKELAEKFAPVVYLYKDEECFPSSVEWFLQRSRIMYQDSELVPTGNITTHIILNQVCDGHSSNDRLFDKDIDGFKLDLRNDPDAKKGDTGRMCNWPCYANVRDVDGTVEIQYWFFYPYNGLIAIVTNTGVHEGDWEHITIRLNNTNTAISSIGYDQHGDFHWQSTGLSEHIVWGSAIIFDTADTSPSVAVSNNGTVVEVHADGHSMYYNTGKLINDRIIWNNNNGIKYDIGSNPSVAINENGQIVEMHKCQNSNKIVYNLGIINGNKISFLNNEGTKFDSGDTAPSVAVSDNGTVVEVHADGHSLYYNIGNIVNNEIRWNKKHGTKYDVGSNPSIAINENGQIVEMHKCKNSDRIVYRTGVLSGKEISFYSDNGIEFDTGDTSPSVAISNNGTVIEVHGHGHSLYYRVGKLINGVIQWNGNNGIKYDAGSNPSAAINENCQIVEMHKCRDSGKIVYDAGKISFSPIVYSAKNSHACYDEPGTHIRIGGLANDETNRGYTWDTRNNIIILKNDPSKENENNWNEFAGRFGGSSSSPVSPAFRSEWVREN